MKKYYVKRDDNNRLIEECTFFNNETRIGSVICTNCEFCSSYSTLLSNNIPWIKCSKINETINNYYTIY